MNNIPLTPPNVERATNIGTIHATGPNDLLPKLCEQNSYLLVIVKLRLTKNIHLRIYLHNAFT